MTIPIEEIHRHVTGAFEGVVSKPAWGETAYFYNPGGRLSSGAYFATLKSRNGENDRTSGLDRPEVWRLAMGIGKQTYAGLFGPPPPRPGKGGVVAGPWEFLALDRITPHPVYGWMSWIAVLNPSARTWATCTALLADAHARARATFEARLRRG